MARKFVLTAQLALQSPTSGQMGNIVAQINKGLMGITANINLKINGATQAQINNAAKGLGSVSKAAHQATNEMEKFGRQSALAIRRFAAFSLATAGFIGLGAAMKHSFGEAIKFDREMIRVAQVTGSSIKELKGLKDEITRLSTSFGISSAKIAGVATTLSQAGLTANETKKALEILAKTELSATFENIKDTTEGAIAIMAQFKTGTGDLEKQLSAMNAVAGQFAVESSDLVTAVRRTGASFKAAGGDLNELMALFTSVRATTRESAESIATGFRTIFARLQRPKTLEYLDALGIKMLNAKGQFIGGYEAVRKLHHALKGIETTDPRFAHIIEELGGFRQIQKVIPLIQEFETSEKALGIAMRSSTSITDDANKAQQALAIQLAKIREEFDALFRKISENTGVRAFIDMSLKLASALIKVADSLEPLIPMLLLFGGAKLASNIGSFSKGFGPALMGKTKGFASGGLVPGHGSGDTVPAMLSPGEFVLTKRAVNNVGLHNVQKFADGGLVGGFSGAFFDTNSVGKTEQVRTPISWFLGKKNKSNEARHEVASFAAAHGWMDKAGNTVGGPHYIKGNMNVYGLNPNAKEIFNRKITEGLPKAMYEAAGQIISPDIPLYSSFNDLFGQQANSIKGQLFEGLIHSATQGINQKGDSPGFDITSKTKNGAHDRLFGAGFDEHLPADLKIHDSSELRNSILAKAIKYYGPGSIKMFANGGSVGSDTVPAMLTPGEFVVNKGAVNRVGIHNLNKINKFAKGGLVGGASSIMNGLGAGGALAFGGIITNVLSSFAGFGDALGGLTTKITALGAQVIVFKTLLGDKFGSPQKSMDAYKAQVRMNRRDDATIKEYRAAERVDVRNKHYRDRFAYDANVLAGTGQYTLAAKYQNKSDLFNKRAQLSSLALLGMEDDYNAAKDRASTRLSRKDLAANARRSAMISNIKNYGAATALAAGEIGGDYLQSYGHRQITAGNYSAGIRNAGIGGALGGAATGAVLGGTIGSFVPVVGTAIGAVAGGLIGGAAGGYNSLVDAGSEAHQGMYGRNVNHFVKRVNAAKMNGYTDADFAKLNRYGNALVDYRNNRSIDEEARTGYNRQLKEMFPASEDALQAAMKKSKDKNFTDFFLKNTGLVNAAAAGSGMEEKDYRSGLKKQFDTAKEMESANKKLKDSQMELIKANEKAYKFLYEFTAKFEASLANMGIMGNNVSEIQGLAMGHINDTNTITRTDALKNLFGSSMEDIRNQAGAGAKIVGPEGAEMARQTVEVAKLVKDLEPIMQEIVSKGLNGDIAGDISSDVVAKLKEKNADFSDKSLDYIKHFLIGEFGTNSSEHREQTMEKLHGRGGFEIAKKAGENFHQADALATSQEMLGKSREFLAKQHSIRRALVISQLDSKANTSSAQDRLDALTDKFDDKRVSAAEILGREQKMKGIYGYNDATSAGKAKTAADAAILAKQQEASRENNPEKVNELNKQIEDLKDKSLDAAKALEYFGNATKRTAQIQEHLNKLESEREHRLGLGETLAFGSPQEKLKLSSTLARAAAIAQDPSRFSTLNSKDQGDVYKFFKDNGTQMFAGKNSKDVFKAIAGQAGLGAFVNPNGEENQLREALKDAIKDEIEATKSQTDTLKAAIDATTAAIVAFTAQVGGQGKGLNPEFKKSRGGRLGFSPGGHTGGIYNTYQPDTIPAMLSRGEFVMSAPAVARIGVDNLNMMNNGYAVGGPVYGPAQQARANIRNRQAIINYNIMQKNRRADGTYRGRILNTTISDGQGNSFDLHDYYKNADAGYRIVGARNIKNNPGVTIFNGRNRYNYPISKIPNEIEQKIKAVMHPNAPIVNAIPKIGRINRGPNPLKIRGHSYGGAIGLSHGGSPDFDTGGLSDAISHFGSITNTLTSALNNFPRHIDMTASHKMEVIINGAEVMSRLIPDLANIVEIKTSEMLQKFKKELIS